VWDVECGSGSVVEVAWGLDVEFDRPAGFFSRKIRVRLDLVLLRNNYL